MNDGDFLTGLVFGFLISALLVISAIWLDKSDIGDIKKMCDKAHYAVIQNDAYRCIKVIEGAKP